MGKELVVEDFAEKYSLKIDDGKGNSVHYTNEFKNDGTVEFTKSVYDTENSEWKTVSTNELKFAWELAEFYWRQFKAAVDMMDDVINDA